jgi:hypothetical protein
MTEFLNNQNDTNQSKQCDENCDGRSICYSEQCNQSEQCSTNQCEKCNQDEQTKNNNNERSETNNNEQSDTNNNNDNNVSSSSVEQVSEQYQMLAYFEKTKKELKKCMKLDPIARIRRLKKKIKHFYVLRNQLTDDSTGWESCYIRLIGRAQKMLNQTYLCQFLALDLTEEICRLLLCVLKTEVQESTHSHKNSPSYKNLLLNKLSANHQGKKTKKLLKAYNDILLNRSTSEETVGEDVCVTFSEHTNHTNNLSNTNVIPSISYYQRQ